MPIRLSRFKTILLKCCLAFVSGIVSLFVCDWALAALGYPSEPPEYFGHPANFLEPRNSIEFRYTFQTNSQGLRHRELPLEKAPGTRRIFVVGDSFTEGDGVSDEDRFSDLLDARFSALGSEVQFLNGGLTGTGPLEYGRFFFGVGTKYSPDALLICVFVNDVANTPEHHDPAHGLKPPKHSLKSRIFDALWPRIHAQVRGFINRWEYDSRAITNDLVGTISKEARSRGIPEGEIDKWQRSLPKELVDAANRGEFQGAELTPGLLYPDYWVDSIDISNDGARKKWENMASILDEIVKEARNRQIEPAVVLIPSKFQYDPRSHGVTDPYVVTGTKVDSKWLVEETEIQRRMKNWAASAQTPLLDLTPVFRQAVKSHSDLNYVYDLHWTPHGHQIAADAIAGWLESQRVFKFIQPQPPKIEN